MLLYYVWTKKFKSSDVLFSYLNCFHSLISASKPHKQNSNYLFTSRNTTGALRRRNIIYEHRREECKRTDMSQDLSRDLLTFSLPVPHQVRSRSHSLLYRTHNSELAAVPLVGVIPAVVLSVARQCRVNAAPCSRKSVKLFLLLWNIYV